jgi:hypothetical protein
VQDFRPIEELVRCLCGLAEEASIPPIAVAHSAPGSSPEVLLPPAHLAQSSQDVATKIVGALATGLPDATAVGIFFRAVRGHTRVEVCVTAEADGHALCVAGRTQDGVGSVGLFRSTDTSDWDEAHAHLDWLCQSLRELVTAGPIETERSALFTIGT